MKRSDWLVLIIVIIIIIAVAFYVAGEDERTTEEKKEDQEKDTFLNRLQNRIKKYNEDIEKEVASLNLSKESEAVLETKVTRWLIVFNVLFLGATAGIFYWFLNYDYSILEAFLATLGVWTAVMAVISMFGFFKILDPNVILDWIKSKIRSWVHKNNKFDPTIIPDLEKSIAVKTETRDVLKQIVENQFDIDSKHKI